MLQNFLFFTLILEVFLYLLRDDVTQDEYSFWGAGKSW